MTAEAMQATLAEKNAEIASLKERCEKAEANYAFMVRNACDEKRPAYDEQQRVISALRERVRVLEERNQTTATLVVECCDVEAQRLLLRALTGGKGEE